MDRTAPTLPPEVFESVVTALAETLIRDYRERWNRRSAEPGTVPQSPNVAVSPTWLKIAEFERARIQERVRAGLARAKAKGVKLGRPRRRIDPKRLATVAGLPEREAARRLGIPRTTLQRFRAQNAQ
jgi:hypothetical protein